MTAVNEFMTALGECPLIAIIRGVRDLIAAFRVRELQHPKPAS